MSIVAFETPANELANLLRSLYSAPLRIHVTVVDNSPTEALRPVVEQSGGEYLPLGHNAGFGAAHNVAMTRSLKDAPYHLVINPDISMNADVLSRLFRFMEEHPDVGQAMPAVIYPDGSEQRLAKRLPSPFDLFLRRFLGRLGRHLAPARWDAYETRDLDLTITREIPCLSGCFMFLRTSVLQRVGLFDERYFMYLEDVDLCRRIGSVSSTVICPDAVVTHGYGKGSYKSLRLLLYHLSSAFRYFCKWGWLKDEGRRAQNKRCERI